VHTNCTENAYSLYWQPVYRFYVLLLESKIFNPSQFLSHHSTRHSHDKWLSSLAFQRFRPAIYSIKLDVQVSDIDSPTSSPFLIQLLLLDFHDVPSAIFNSSTICRRSEPRVMKLAAWIDAACQLSFVRVSDMLWPLFQWVVWHHWLKLCQ